MVYAALLFAVAVIIRLIYGVYCTRHFPECSTGPKYDKSIYKEMSGFAGWNFIGTSSSVIRDQGNNVVLNLFFGTVVNAAYGIGMQVSNAAYSFSQNFMTALNPQITKSYALGDFAYLSTLVLRGCAVFRFYLLWMIAVVILLNTDYRELIKLKNEAHEIEFMDRPFNGKLVLTSPLDEAFSYLSGGLLQGKRRSDFPQSQCAYGTAFRAGAGGGYP